MKQRIFFTAILFISFVSFSTAQRGEKLAAEKARQDSIAAAMAQDSMAAAAAANEAAAVRAAIDDSIAAAMAQDSMSAAMAAMATERNYDGNINLKWPVKLSFETAAFAVGSSIDGGISYEGKIIYVNKQSTLIIKGQSILETERKEREYPHIVLNEYAGKEFVGKFHLTFNESETELNGTWYSPDESKMYPVRLKLLE